MTVNQIKDQLKDSEVDTTAIEDKEELIHLLVKTRLGSTTQEGKYGAEIYIKAKTFDAILTRLQTKACDFYKNEVESKHSAAERENKVVWKFQQTIAQRAFIIILVAFGVFWNWDR